MDCAFVTAGSVVEQLESLGLLREITGQERNRLYNYHPYVDVFQRLAVQDQKLEWRRQPADPWL